MLQLTAKGKRFYASVRVSGSKSDIINLLVDTGSDYTHIDDKKCKELRLTPNGAKGVACIHGKIESRPRYIGRVQIDEIKVAGMTYAIPDLDIIGFIHEDQEKKVEEKQANRSDNLMGVLGNEFMSGLKLNIEWSTSSGILDN